MYQLYWWMHSSADAYADSLPDQSTDAPAATAASNDTQPSTEESEEQEPPPIDSDYLLIGGGVAAFAAMEAIYRNDENAKVRIA